MMGETVSASVASRRPLWRKSNFLGVLSLLLLLSPPTRAKTLRELRLADAARKKPASDMTWQYAQGTLRGSGTDTVTKTKGRRKFECAVGPLMAPNGEEEIYMALEVKGKPRQIAVGVIPRERCDTSHSKFGPYSDEARVHLRSADETIAFEHMR